MKKIYLIILILLLNFSFVVNSESEIIDLTNDAGSSVEEGAQSEEIIIKKEQYKDALITAVISVDGYVKRWEEIKLNASSSLLMTWKDTTYKWNINWVTKWWEKVKFVFDDIWRKEIGLSVSQWTETSNVKKYVIAYRSKALFITDRDVDSWLSNIVNQAANDWIWLRVIKYSKDLASLSSNESLIESFYENKDYIDDSQIILFDTKNSWWLWVFSEFMKKSNSWLGWSFKDKLFVKISEWNLEIERNIVDRFFNTLWVSRFLITRIEALNPIFQNYEWVENLKLILNSRAVEYFEIDEKFKKSSLLVFSNLISYLVWKWVPMPALYLLLAFPFISFFIVLSRHVFWLSAFWIYLPTLISLSFFVLWLNFWLIVLCSILFVSYLVRKVIENIEIPFIPKSSLMLTSIALSYIVLIWIFVEFEIEISLSTTIFPMIIMSRISEKFMWAQLEDGSVYAFISTIQTVVISVIAFLLVNWFPLNNLIISMPEVVFIPLLLNILVWKYKGLRLSEYFKFRELLKDWLQE